MNALTVAVTPNQHLISLVRLADGFASQARAESTKEAYRKDWAAFTEWCALHNANPLPASPETVALFLTDQTKRYSLSTLNRRLSAISQAHKTARYDPPTSRRAEPLHSIWSGIIRSKGRAQKQKEPLLIEHIRKIIDTLPVEHESPIKRLRAYRDKALILMGLAGGFRRSEIAALNIEDFTFVPEGMKILLRRSKTDQEGLGRTVHIPYCQPRTCPVVALQEWFEAAEIEAGAAFRSVLHSGEVLERMAACNVATRIKQLMKNAGFDPSNYSGHSLRAGCATSAARGGARERDIMRLTGHKSVQMVRRYIREGDGFLSNAVSVMGL